MEDRNFLEDVLKRAPYRRQPTCCAYSCDAIISRELASNNDLAQAGILDECAKEPTQEKLHLRQLTRGSATDKQVSVGSVLNKKVIQTAVNPSLYKDTSHQLNVVHCRRSIPEITPDFLNNIRTGMEYVNQKPIIQKALNYRKKLNDMAANLFESNQEEQVSEGISIMNDLIPCMHLIFNNKISEEDLSSIEEMRNRWCSYFGQDITIYSTHRIEMSQYKAD